ncbi:putative Hybrid PKS-NRPS biosynthetic cluster [Myotisia sp. PD_48]|nr:putative Hybrid PKS-NRPS biosynthetic cluster [Myotisia sp. PD_48]
METMGSNSGGSSSNISDAGSVSSVSTAPSQADDFSCVVGMACRVPGASSPSKLWENIMTKRDVQQKMPANRYNVDAFYHPEGPNKGTTNAKYGYFLEQDLGLFDAGFFHISGKEAEAMDPQQRLLLEVVYEALENAGISLDEIRGTQTSVYCGCFTNDYDSMIVKDLEYYPKYTVTGTGDSILANRISYFYDLHGPSMTIDTACSSSLIALHLGNQSLLTGESELSIIVGSALHFDPNIFITMTDLGMLSRDGRCRHGDAAGSGYVRGEGITAIVMKRQSLAENAGNPIHSVVRASGSNHDGKKQGITLPSAKSQAALIERVYRDAGLSPADTQYVECHGTGTAAGDPRELRALSSVFASTRDDPLWVGSVKTNIGHLEGASGLAGIIKATMALQKRTIPPNMHYNSPNPEVDFKGWKLQIPTSPVEWKVSSDNVRRVSINSFGYGGSNAHIILEEYTPTTSNSQTMLPGKYAAMTTKRPYLAPLTSHSDKAGKSMADKLAAFLEANPTVRIADFATTLSVQRSMHSYRSFAYGSSHDALVNHLKEPLPVANWNSKINSTPKLGFVFTGQGAQWYGMGRQLIEMSPLFLQALERCDNVLQGLPDKPDWTVVGELLKNQEDSRLTETRFSQPICTALQLALITLLSAWGIKPSAVVGHSSGELAATYAAGILSFENAMVAAYYRGLYMGNAAASKDSVPGAMMAVGLTETETVKELKPYAGRIAIAAMNSPSSFTLSGDEDAIVELQKILSDRKVFARRLQVGQAFHSHHMHPLAPGYERALKNHPGFAPQPPTVRMFSSVTARVADYTNMGPSYYAANMTGQVKFSDALTGIVLNEEDQQNVDALIEIGPHAALKGPSNQTLGSLNLKIPYISTLDRKVPAYESILSTAGQLFAMGYPVNLNAVNQEQYFDSHDNIVTVNNGQRTLDFPSYAWDHQRYWAETRVIKSHRLRKFRHQILGAPVPGCLDDRPRYRNYLRLSEMPWLADHAVSGKVVFPGAGYITMAIEGAIRMGNTDEPIKQIYLRDIAVKSALMVSSDDMGTEVLLELRPAIESSKSNFSTWKEFAIFSFDGEHQREHCTGLIQVERGEEQPIHRIRQRASAAELRAKSNRTLAQSKYYQRLATIGLNYGPTFQLLNGNVESGRGFATGEIEWKPENIAWLDEANSSVLHPSFLDSSLHPIFAAVEGIIEESIKESYIPTFMRSLKVSGLLNRKEFKCEGFKANVAVDTIMNGPRVAISNVGIEGMDGQVLVDIEGLEVTSLGSDADEQQRRTLFFGFQWKPAFEFLTPEQAKDLTIPELIEVYIHQFPNLRFLHYSSSDTSTEELLAKLGGNDGERRKFGNMTVIPVGSADPSTFESIVDRWNGLVSLESPQADDKFDVIIASEDHAQPTSLENLGDNGLVIAHSSQGPTDEIRQLWATSGFNVLQKGEKSSASFDNLTLLMPSNASAETEALAKSIESSASAQVTRKDFLSLRNGTKLDEDIISLYGLDVNIFYDNPTKHLNEFKAVQSLVSDSDRNIVWISQGALMDAPCPEQAVFPGVARTIRHENENLRLVVLDITKSTKSSLTGQFVLNVLDRAVHEEEIAIRNGKAHVSRVHANDVLNAKVPNGFKHNATLQPLHQANKPLKLVIGRPGLLESLSFADDTDLVNQPLGDDELEIQVKASAINFRDLSLSMGSIEDYKLGDECAGIVIRKGPNVPDSQFKLGDRVVALRPGEGAHKTIVRNPACYCANIGSLPFSQAAAFALALTTAYFSLVEAARLRADETILIHAAAGGVGQMAIQIAQSIGAKIIATVSSQAKVDLLKNTYGLTDDQILYSRDDTFVEGVHNLTNGQGVDVVLNSLTGSLLHATWTCLAPFGRFIEIGRRDISQNSKLEMNQFRNNATFTSVDMKTMFSQPKRAVATRAFQEACNLFLQNKVKPIQTVEFDYADCVKAFRLLQQGNTTQKVVLIPGEDSQVLVQPTTMGRQAVLNPEKTYLLVGGLGGLGQKLSEWLYRRGARNLAFLSRSGADKPEGKEVVQWLENRNVNVRVFKADVANFEAVNACIQSVKESLAGVFQAAMVLQDSPFDKMTFNQWKTSTTPKVYGTENLHKATLDIPLDFFVCFSSLSGAIGTKGQGNYAAGNTYIDAICRHRREMGLPATTMNIGMVVGIGAVSEDAQLQAIMERVGYDPVNEEELFFQIETSVAWNQYNILDSNGFDGHQTVTGLNMRRPDFYWTEGPRMKNLYLNHDFTSTGSGNKAQQSVMTLLRAATTADDRLNILTDAFIDKIATILSIDKENVQPSRGLADYGLDSIVAIEIRKWFFKSVAVELALFDVLGSSSIRGLVEKVSESIVLEEAQTEDTTKQEKSKRGSKAKTSQSSDEHHLGEKFKVSPEEDVPMSTFQRRLWFIHNLIEDKSFLNLPLVARIKGKPDIQLFQKALEEVKRRNEVLRTAYYEGDSFAQQMVTDDCSSDLNILDFSDAHDPEADLEDYVYEQTYEPLDIENGENIRSSLIQLSENEYTILCVVHHISFDRGSGETMLDQMCAIYNCLRNGDDLEGVKSPPVSYAEFTKWHNDRLNSPELQKDVDFWKAKYEDLPGPTNLLPFAKAERPEANDYQRNTHKTTLKKSAHLRMKRICARLGITPAQFLMAAFRTFIYRHTEQDDLTIHMIDGNRPHPSVNETMGFFVNVIPVRCSTTNDGDFESLLREMSGLVLESLAHSNVPFDLIVDAVGVPRNPAYFPLGQVVVNYQMHGKIPTYTTVDFTMSDIGGKDIPTASEMQLEATEDPDEGLKLSLEYSSTLYGDSDMDRFLDNFIAFMNSAIRDHRQPISEISMVGPKELAHLKSSFFSMDFVENQWQNQSVASRILDAARQSPNDIAIETSDGDKITYQALVEKAQRIGAVIGISGVRPGSRVGVFANPGIHAVSAMMGCLFSRCGYVSLDPSFATERLAFMATDSGMKLLLTEKELEQRAKDIAEKATGALEVCVLENISELSPSLQTAPKTAKDDPFYMIYTSGSTGTPKGVVLSQSNTQQMLSTLQTDYKFSSNDRFLHHSSICFDLSVVQIFSALTCGACVCVASASTRKDPVALAKYMDAAQVSVTYFTPTQFALLIEHAKQSLQNIRNYRIAYFAGERLPVRVARAFYDLGTPAVAFNTWSPSELVVQTTIQRVEYPSEDEVSIPIGFPMANTRHYIMDKNCQPLPAGFIGEIVVGGAQVGLGYLNRPDANRTSFVIDPFCTDEDRRAGWTRMFRSGDKGRFRPDGSLEFHGRIAGDKQIKLRGFRIDLGEVEQRLFVESKDTDGEPQIVDISVVARSPTKVSPDDITDNRQLVAFLVTKKPLADQKAKQAFAFDIHTKAGNHLNSYMLPNGYQFLDSLPVTIGGKVDRQRLLNCDLSLTYPSAVVEAPEPQSKATKSDTPDQKIVDEVLKGFREILKLPEEQEIGVNDSFFELGGQSILMLRLQAKLKRALKVPPTLAMMFEKPTPMGIAQAIWSKSKDDSDGEIDWSKEIDLPETSQYLPDPNRPDISPSDITEVLLTGVESFHGIHMLATLLRESPNLTIYTLGLEDVITLEGIISVLKQWDLMQFFPDKEALASRIRCVPGVMVSPGFGLPSEDFQTLGQNIQAIYNFASRVSLLQSYDDLRAYNVEAVRHLLELACLGRVKTHMHHLSTWSVVHLQSWSTTIRQRRGRPVAQEVSASHFTPESNSRFGYFKSRWAAEMLIEKGAARGIPSTIYRASAIGASSETAGAEPDDSFARRMILGIVESNAIPKIGQRGLEFVIDFLPVDYMTKCVRALASSDAASHEDQNPIFHHIVNPSPVKLPQLVDMMKVIKSDNAVEPTTQTMDDWLTTMARIDTEPGAEIRWTVLKGYFQISHNMFALDQRKTKAALKELGVEPCFSIDANVLKDVYQKEKAARLS